MLISYVCNLITCLSRKNTLTSLGRVYAMVYYLLLFFLKKYYKVQKLPKNDCTRDFWEFENLRIRGRLWTALRYTSGTSWLVQLTSHISVIACPRSSTKCHQVHRGGNQNEDIGVTHLMERVIYPNLLVEGRVIIPKIAWKMNWQKIKKKR